MPNDIEVVVDRALPESQESPFVLALSGGIDSMTLFHVLLKLKKSFVVAHVNHKLRVESDNEYDQINILCKSYDIPFEGSIFNGDGKGNFQKKARLFRQDFFKKMATKYHSTTILTAHHYDDVVETFLMRLIEGRSLSGLNPMKKIMHSDDGFTFIKPFVTINKADITHYAYNWDIAYFKDLSNQSSGYTRNWIRNYLIPHTEKRNPSFTHTIKSTMDDIEEFNDFLDDEVKTHPMYAKTMMNIATFSTFSKAFKRRFLRRKIEHYDPSLYPSKKFLDSLIAQLGISENFLTPLNDSYTLHKEYGKFFIKKNSSLIDAIKPIVINGMGTYTIDQFHKLVVTDKKKDTVLTKPYILWYNTDIYPLFMRTRENGDTIKFPYGHKKLNRLFIDRKIAPHKREELLILTDTYKNVLWIPSLDVKQQSSKGKHCLYFYFITANMAN